MSTSAKCSEVRPLQEFLFEGKRFMKLPDNLRRYDGGALHEVNAIQLGGGDGFGETHYVATNADVRLCE